MVCVLSDGKLNNVQHLEILYQMLLVGYSISCQKICTSSWVLGRLRYQWKCLTVHRGWKSKFFVNNSHNWKWHIFIYILCETCDVKPKGFVKKRLIYDVDLYIECWYIPHVYLKCSTWRYKLWHFTKCISNGVHTLMIVCFRYEIYFL